VVEWRGPGIRAWLLALLLPCSVALLALDSWNDYHAISHLVQDAYDQALLEPVQALDDSVGRGPDGSVRVEGAFSVQSMFDVTRARHKFLHVGVTQGDGEEQTLMGVSDLPAPPPSTDGVPIYYDAVYRTHPVRIVALRRTLTGPGTLSYQVLSQAAESLGARLQAQTESWHQALWSGLRLVCVMVLVIWLGVAWVLRPLDRLSASLRARAPGNLDPLDASQVPHEVVPLVEAVNHHIADHRRVLAGQSRFLADASHQLRTPLAIMLTQAGYAVREPDVDRMQETLHAIIAQLTRARRLTDQLLALAQASHDGGDAALMPSRVDLNAIAREVVLLHLPLAREKDQDLGWVDACSPGTVAADELISDGLLVPVMAVEAELQESLSNLIHNAISYTPRGGQITVSAHRDTQSAWIEVNDTGPGIPALYRAQAFERFQRISHTASTGQRHGAGLGLAIARAYAQRHGGDIELADSTASNGQTPGLRAILRLPLSAYRALAG